MTNFFENLYAMEIGDWVSERAKLYGRYGDDIADSSIEKIEYRFRRKAERIVVRKRKKKLSGEQTMREFIAVMDRRFLGHGGEKHELDWCRWAFPVIT